MALPQLSTKAKTPTEPAQPQTFSTMQQQGVPRPPSPTYQTMGAPTPTNSTNGGGFTASGSGAQKPSTGGGFPYSPPPPAGGMGTTQSPPTGGGLPYPMPTVTNDVDPQTPSSSSPSRTSTVMPGPGTPWNGQMGAQGQSATGGAAAPKTIGSVPGMVGPQIPGSPGYTGGMQPPPPNPAPYPAPQPPQLLPPPTPHQSGNWGTTPPSTQPTAPTPIGYQQPGQWNQIGGQLQNQWQNATGPAPFVPGSNPFNNPGFGQQLQNQWQNYQGSQGFTSQPGALDPQIQQMLQQQLANPSAYNSQVVGQTYDDLNRKLSQDYDYQRQKLMEQMARRGIDASTIHGNRYSDLGAEQGYAQADLAHQLLSEQAKQYGTDMSTALQNAMGYSGQQFGQNLAGYQANQANNSQNFSQQQALLNNVFNQGSQQYAQDQNTYQTNLGAQQQGWNQKQQALQNLLGFGQQDFENQMGVNQFNANQQNQFDQLMLALMGGIG